MRLLPTRSVGRTLALVSCLSLLLAACGSDEADGGDESEASQSTGESGTAEAADADGRNDDSSTDASSPGGGLTVVATTSILGDVVTELVGDEGEVTVLMEPGVDPHAYQPSAADTALLREADLVVANGLNLEESLLSVLEAAKEDGARILEVTQHLDPIAFDADEDDHGHDGEAHDDADEDDHGHDDADEDDHGHDEEAPDDGDDHDHGPEDPHVWFDPVRMVDGVDLIAAELGEVSDTVDADEWQARADAYNEELVAVHAELEALFEAIPEDRRRLVTNHEALGYLAHRYDLEVIGTVIPGSSTQAEADARAFAELAETIEEAGVEVVFAENTDSTVLAEQLASEVVGRSDLDVEVVGVYTDALGEDGSGAETYLGLLRTTGQRIADALA